MELEPARRHPDLRGDRDLTKAQEILRRLQRLGARIVRDGDRLRLRAGRAPIPGDLVAAARAEKAAIMALPAACAYRLCHPKDGRDEP